MFETAIAAKPDAICIGAIDQEACVAGMEKAQSAGIPIFCYDNGVNSDIPVTTLATNDLEATRTLAEKTGEELGGKGSILIIGHDQTSKNGKERTNGLIDALAELYPDMYSYSSLTRRRSIRCMSWCSNMTYLSYFMWDG